MSEPAAGPPPRPASGVVAQRVRGSRSYRLIAACAVLAVVLAVANLGWQHLRATRGAAQGTATIQAIRQVDGVVALTAGLQRDIGPLITTPQRAVRLDDLDPADEPEALAALQEALGRYPPGFVHRLIDRVALAGGITFFGNTDVGGFFVPRAVAINCGGDWTAEHRAFVSRTFHHEFSSLVRLAAPLDDAAWRAGNPDGFAYLSYAEYRAILSSDKPDRGGADLYARGFVRSYGMTDIDNDWNTYAERIFGDGAAFAGLIKDYPRLRAKTRVFLDTYSAMDPRFEAYFGQTGLRTAATPK